MEAGASDFFFTPIQMKKGRPGLKISVLASPKNIDKVNAFLLEHTSTIGLRYHLVKKERLPRNQYSISTPYGDVKVKEVEKPSGRKSTKVEYESIIEISKKYSLPIQQVKEEIEYLLKTKNDEKV
jgi:hypothetical protein